MWYTVKVQDGEIERQFFTLSNTTEKALVRKGVSVSEIVSHVTRSCEVPSSKKPVVLQNLDQAPDIPRIFAILVVNKYMTCIKYGILKSLIGTFCKEELSDGLKRFEEIFKKYIKRKIRESPLILNQRVLPPQDVLGEENDNSLSEETLMLFTHDIWDPSNTVEDLLHLQEKVCNIYGIPYMLIKIRGIIPNCLILCLTIPSCWKEAVKQLRHEQVTRLIYFGFIKEQCGDTIHDLEDMCKYGKSVH